MKKKLLLMLLVAAAMFAGGNMVRGDIVTRQIQVDLDDAEEFLNTAEHHGWYTGVYAQGNGWMDSSDLEVGEDDPLFWQVCAVQYDQLGIPLGAYITSAKLTLQVDEPGSAGTSNDYTILAEAADNASVFSQSGGWLERFNITNRARSTASVGWNPPIGAAVNEKVDTPDISALIEEVVNQSGWSDNNRLTLMIYPDVYLALPDPTTGGSTDLATTVYRAGPGTDSATLTVEYIIGIMDRSPPNGSYVTPGDVKLSWTNMDPNKPGDSVWVDVWFGTDPNELNDYNKIVDANENTTYQTVSAPIDGETYYWQVDSYIYGDPAVVAYNSEPNAAVIASPIWSFTALDDAPPASVVIDTADKITWSDEPVGPLASTVVDDGKSALDYLWTAAPAAGVVFTPNDSDPAPTVTITKPAIILVPFVTNGGFEDPPLDDGDFVYNLGDFWRDGYYWEGGWYDDPYYAGIENPDTAYGGIVPEGENAAFQYSYYSDTYGGYDMGLRQILAATLAPDTHYELSVMVGNPDAAASNDYRVELLAGGRVIDANSAPSPAPGTWTDTPVTLTYDSPSTVTAGQALEIRLVLVDDGSTDQKLNFDDVTLLIDGESSWIDPLLSVEVAVSVNDQSNPGSVTDSMTIDVYNTACLAARLGLGLGAANPSDVDADCVTDIDDLASVALKWLNDTSPTAAFAKP